MKTKNIVRAWKDPEFRKTLNDAERALVPENPAGLIELPDEVLEGVAGGWRLSIACTSHRTCGDNCGTNAHILC